MSNLMRAGSNRVRIEELVPRLSPTGTDRASNGVSLGIPAERVEEFVRLTAQHQRRLHHFVASLIPFAADADDVIQETQLVLWREFERFESGSNFASWACTVAFNQVLAWRKKRQRDRLVMSEEFLVAVSRELIDDAERLEERDRLLNGCLERLPPHHRDLLRMRYAEGNTVEAMATRLNRTCDAVYRMLSRIRGTLHE